MNRRVATLLGALSSVPFLAGFFWPQYFDISWDEEVQLHDGRVIVVHLKFTYERLSRLSRYDRSILRDTEMSFDAGTPHGRVTQLFRRQKPVLLDQKDGKWYVVLAQRGSITSIRDEDWGPVQTASGHRVGLLKAGRFEPTPIDFLPVEFERPNLDYHYGPFSELIELDGNQLAMSTKSARSRKYPLGPGHRSFERPSPSVFPQMQSKEATKSSKHPHTPCCPPTPTLSSSSRPTSAHDSWGDSLAGEGLVVDQRVTTPAQC